MSSFSTKTAEITGYTVSESINSYTIYNNSDRSGLDLSETCFVGYCDYLDLSETYFVGFCDYLDLSETYFVGYCDYLDLSETYFVGYCDYLDLSETYFVGYCDDLDLSESYFVSYCDIMLVGSVLLIFFNFLCCVYLSSSCVSCTHCCQFL
jgi:hypothetical protein